MLLALNLMLASGGPESCASLGCVPAAILVLRAAQAVSQTTAFEEAGLASCLRLDHVLVVCLRASTGERLSEVALYDKSSRTLGDVTATQSKLSPMAPATCNVVSACVGHPGCERSVHGPRLLRKFHWGHCQLAAWCFHDRFRCFVQTINLQQLFASLCHCQHVGTQQTPCDYIEDDLHLLG